MLRAWGKLQHWVVWPSIAAFKQRGKQQDSSLCRTRGILRIRGIPRTTLKPYDHPYQNHSRYSTLPSMRTQKPLYSGKLTDPGRFDASPARTTATKRQKESRKHQANRPRVKGPTDCLPCPARLSIYFKPVANSRVFY